MAEGKERRGSAGPKKPNARPSWKRKDVRYRARTLVIGDDVWMRIAVESVSTDRDKSAIADALLYEAMRGCVISRRRPGTHEGVSANPGDGVEPAVEDGPIGEDVSPPGGESAAEGPGQGRGGGGGKKRSA